MTRKTDKRCLASFTKPFFPLEEAHMKDRREMLSIFYEAIFSFRGSPYWQLCLLLISPSHHHHKLAPSTSKCYMASVSFTHVHFDYGHAYLCHLHNWSGKESIMITAFPLDFFIFQFASFVCTLYPLLLFLLWRCFEKIDQMWSDYHFLIFLRILVHWIDAKELSENSWEMTVGFSRTILHGNLARSREYEQYRNLKQRQQKGEETKFVMRWQENKSDRIFLSSGKVPFLVRGTTSGASEGRVGESQT